MFTRIRFPVALSAGLLLCGVAQAATQGTLGASSTGTAEITISKGDVVLITNITDVNFPQWTAGGGDQNADGQACVYSSTGSYSIQATSTNGTGVFEMTDGSNNALAYTLSWIDDQSGAAAVPLNSGQVNTTTMAGSSSTSCADLSGVNARFAVSITEAALDAVPAGSYSDTLTLTVAPI
ncbi:MAG: hypothetical protein AAGA11_15560 [Pseudomonadota bacterium]